MGARSSTKGKVNHGRNGNRTGKKKDGINFCDEAVLLFLLALCIILFLGNFGLAGGNDSGGNWLSNRLRGLIGITEYLFPVLLFVSAFFCIVRKGNTRIYRKCAVAFFMMIDIAAIVQVLRGNHFEGLFEQGMTHVFSGGLIGGMIAKWLYSFLGLLGAVVVLIILFVLCVVYMTELSFVRGVEKQSRRVYENTREDVKRRRMNHESRREELEQQRRERREQELEQQREEERHREEMELRLQKKREQERVQREAEEREEKRKREKIAKQMTYMEKDMQEREERLRKCGKKEYVNANGRTIVTLEQPERPVKNPKEKRDVHEIFPEPGGMTQQEPDELRSAASFTIHRGGEVSQIEVSRDGEVRREDMQPAAGAHADEQQQLTDRRWQI